MITNCQNLFNGNEVLSKTLNDVLNENWKDVWTELQEGINHALEVIITNISNEIFSNLSIAEMYAD